ncbi:MAG: hypothetical protein H0W12_04635 [Chitinophagaceae bacterium]|nr:hypothetical protein [Chitinophagaceae bacterium]
MNNNLFLLSMPSGAEWMLVIIVGIFLTIFPLLAIVFYSETKKLRKENRELLEKILNKN